MSKILMLLDEWYSAVVVGSLKNLADWDTKENAGLKRLTAAANKNEEPKANDKKAIPKPEPTRMHAEGPANFLGLSAALKLILERSINIVNIPWAKTLLQGYVLGYLKVVSHHLVHVHCMSMSICTLSFISTMISQTFTGSLLFLNRYLIMGPFTASGPSCLSD